MKKEKTVLLVRKEAPFPDFSFFRVLNRFYWWIIFNFIILRIIRKYQKNKDFLVVCDSEQHNKIKKVCENVALFGDYIITPKKCLDPYIKTIKIARDFAKKFKKIFFFEGHDIAEYIAEELAYDLVNFIDEFELMKEIKRREKVNQFIVLGKEQNYVKIASLMAEIKNISCMNISDIIRNIRRFLRKYSLEIRMSLPVFFNNREFIKQNKNKKIRGKKKILFAGFDISDILRIMPLIELTRKKNKEFVVLTNYKNSKKFLEDKKIPYVFFGDFLDKRDKKIVRKKKKELINEWKRVKENGNLTYDAIKLWKAIENEIEYRFFTRALWTMYYIKASQGLLKNINIIINEGDLSPRCRSLVEVGKKYKIPAIFIQEGATITKDTPRGFVPLISDKTAVWGQSTKEFLENYKIESKKIVITGCSKFDPYIESKKIEEEIYEKLNIKENEKFFVLATEPSERGYFMDKERIELIKTVAEVMKEFPDFKLIIKLHPREIKRKVQEIIKIQDIDKEKIRIIQDIPVEDLLRISKLLININSTVAIEAILLNVPVINADIFNCRPEIEMFKKFNVGILIKNKEQLKKAIERILDRNYKKSYEKSRKKFISWYLYKIDGKSSERILTLIEKMIA